MELLPNSSKHAKDVIQSGHSGYADSKGKRESSANLNLNPVSSFHLHQTMDSAVLDEQNQNYLEAKPEGKAVAKVAVTIETGKCGLMGTPLVSPVERDNVFQPKSKIPALTSSLMSEDQLNRRGVQRLKSPNLKHTPTLSPKALSNTKKADNPSNLTVDEKEKSEVHKESASVSIPNPHTINTREETTKTAIKILKVNTSQKCEGEISQNTHSSTTSVRQKVKEDSKLGNQTPTLKTNIENERDGTVLLGTKNSKSPKMSTEKKNTGTTSKNASRPKENINSTASSTKHESKDNLDCKSGPVSKTNLGSKDSSDLKTGSSSNSKSGKGSRDGLSKTAVDSSKLRPVLHTSKSAGADLSLPLPVSPRPISAKRSPGSVPKSLGPSGPSREAQRSPGAARG